MSLRIIKAGILDTIQDEGRFGFQSIGINPSGVMDRFASRLANCLLGKPMEASVVEIHFPAPSIKFEDATVICIAGADFSPAINNKSISINQPVIVNRGATLTFKRLNNGARCYLSILQEFSLDKWLNSYSTNLKASAGGYEGRQLQKGDVLLYAENKAINAYVEIKDFIVMPFKAHPGVETEAGFIEIMEGHEWGVLTEESQKILLRESFAVSRVADRMGYRLKGEALKVKEQAQLVSSAVSFGTIQLLPNGQLIVLMADHQTTGGYPRVGHVISAHLPAMAQTNPGDSVRFKMVSIETAEQKLLKQQQYLLSVQYASAFKIEKILQ